MAEAVVSALAATYVANMFSKMAREVSWDVTSEIHSVEVKLRDLKNLIADADRRNITDRSVREWVGQLRVAMYGATDILDLCQLEAMERGSSAADGMGCFSPLLSCKRNHVYAHGIRSRIKVLNQRLATIREHRDALSFLDLVSQHSGRHETSTELDWSGSGVVGDKIEEDTKALVAKIIQTRNEVNNNSAVVAIVGVCGIGKTTLARKVFNDEAIQDEFDAKIWLSVSKDPDKAELLRIAITSAGGVHSGHRTMALLWRILTAALRGKKVLLVMDDLWNHTAWEDVLKRPFVMAAAHGSRVLITTRDERVAQWMRAEHPYHRVNKLGPEDAWSLLKKQVVSSETVESEIDKLKDIGLQIIANCGGLPLAVKVMGALLFIKDTRRRDWERVLNDSRMRYKMLEEINYSVYLSYEDMSPCLKQCFLHYSLLPTNIVFYENDIVGMWISEGFVEGNSEELEEIGSGYYSELILMNLIEADARYTSQRVCYMNEVVRSFAHLICRDEAQVAHIGEANVTSYVSHQKFIRLSLESKGLESDVSLESFTRTDIIENTNINWPDKT